MIWRCLALFVFATAGCEPPTYSSVDVVARGALLNGKRVTLEGRVAKHRDGMREKVARKDPKTGEVVTLEHFDLVDDDGRVKVWYDAARTVKLSAGQSVKVIAAVSMPQNAAPDSPPRVIAITVEAP